MNRLHENDLDRLFAEKLDDLRVEPPERSWKKVAAGVAITTTVSTTVLSNLIRPVVWSLSTIATIVLVTVTNPSSNNKFTASPLASGNEPALDIEIERISPLSAAEEIPVIYTQETPDLMPVNILPAAEETSTDLAENELLPISNEFKPVVFDSMDYLKSLNSALLNVPQLSWHPEKLASPELLQPDKGIIPAWFDLSYQTGPDIFDFGIQDEEKVTSIAINNGIDISFHFSDFYLRSGVNVLSLMQRNQYDYTMNEFQQVGEYTMVDSISFIQGTDTAGMPYWIPQYYTSAHPVFDSVAVIHSTKSPDWYHYLEIPFALGFQKDIHRISVFAQGGFSYSLLMKSSELSQNSFSEETGYHPLNWQSQSLSRNKDFWSFTLSAGIMYNTNSRLSIGIEPSYRYCLSPFYTGDENPGKAPVSYGLKLKLQYKLSY